MQTACLGIRINKLKSYYDVTLFFLISSKGKKGV